MEASKQWMSREADVSLFVPVALAAVSQSVLWNLHTVAVFLKLTLKRALNCSLIKVKTPEKIPHFQFAIERSINFVWPRDGENKFPSFLVLT